MTTERDRPPALNRRIPHPRPGASSTNSSSMAIAPSRTNPTRDLCRKLGPSLARSPTSSTPLSPPLGDTRLEPDLEDLLWSTVNLFHRAVARIERELDDNEQAQRRGQKEQDGSEIRSVELERLTAEGMTLIERRNSMEFFRDQAAEQFERHTGSTWRPRSGSMVNHRALTSAMIDSPRFPRRQAAGRDRRFCSPPVPRSPSPAGSTSTMSAQSGTRLDKVHAKHPDMVLLHGGSPKGAELHRRQMGRHP